MQVGRHQVVECLHTENSVVTAQCACRDILTIVYKQSALERHTEAMSQSRMPLRDHEACQATVGVAGTKREVVLTSCLCDTGQVVTVFNEREVAVETGPCLLGVSSLLAHIHKPFTLLPHGYRARSTRPCCTMFAAAS